MISNDRRILLFGAIAHSLTHGYMLIFPAVLLLIVREFDTGLFRAGLLGNVAYLAFGLGALPAGWLADRFGARGVVHIFLFGAAGAAILTAAVSSFALLFPAFLLLGLFCSLYHPPGLSIVSTIRDRGGALAWHGVWGNVSIAVAPMLFASIGAVFGWRGAYLVAGVSGLLLAGAAMTIRFETGAANRAGNSGPLAEEGKRGSLTILYFLVALNGFVYRGFLTFLPAWLSQGGGGEADLMRGGTVTSVALLFGIAGQLFGGKMYRKFSREILLFLLTALTVPFLWWTGHSSWPLTVAAAAIFLFFHFASQPVVNGLVAQYTRLGRRSVGYGFSFFLAFGTGSFASSACGYIADRWGMPQLFTFLCGFAVALTAIALILILRRDGASAGEPGTPNAPI